MFNTNHKLAWLVVCLILVACGSAPEKKNAASVEATKQCERGTAAFVQGDYAGAVHAYGQALSIDQSVENAAGIAIARINLARAWRELSRPDRAHEQLDALFTVPVLPYPATSLAVAATLQSQLYLESNELQPAVKWLERGETLCQKKCPAAASMLLLRAQLAMRDQNLADAGKLVDEAISLLDTPGLAIELANALRLSGEIFFAGHDDANAASKFEQALALDQRLGLSAKIRLDLLRLAETAEHAGRTVDAQNYAARAKAVNGATGDAQGVPVRVVPPSR